MSLVRGRRRRIRARRPRAGQRQGHQGRMLGDHHYEASPPTSVTRNYEATRRGRSGDWRVGYGFGWAGRGAPRWRRSLPKALGVILTPGGAWRRLYSLASTIAITRATVAGSNPWATISSAERSSSTYSARIGSSTSYGGSVSTSLCCSRSSAVGARSRTPAGITGWAPRALRHRARR